MVPPNPYLVDVATNDPFRQMIVALTTMQQFPLGLHGYPHLPWPTTPSTPMALSIDGIATSNFATLNFFPTTPNIPSKVQSPTHVASTTNIVFSQPNNQVLEKSLRGRSKQIEQKACH